MNALIILTYLLGVLICGRLFFLSVIRHDFYLAKANIQQSLADAQMFSRGDIFLENRQGEFYPLAINKAWPLAYVEPKKIKNTDLVILARTLSSILKIDENSLLNKISDKNDPFEILKHELSAEEAEAIKNLHIDGIGTQMEENLRYYPAKNLACHVVGFLGYQDDQRVGQYGVEEFYNDILTTQKVDANPSKELKEGEDLVLTVDPNIQLFIEEGLEKIAKNYNAAGGTVIVMDPRNGKIMAMANYPDFDPNEYSEVKDFDIFINSAVSSVFEPGSVFKPIMMSIALDQGIVSPASTYYDEGFVKIGGYTIYNATKQAFGTQTMTQVLEKSLNTGIVYVEKLLKQSVITKYFQDYGFGKKTSIDLPGETNGNIINLESGRDINFATAAFGQGIAVTPIQLIRAIGAIANKGELVKPTIIERVIKDDKIQEEVMDASTSTSVQQVISIDTANRLTAMLVSVTENGTGKRAKIPGYWIALKTGTAQIPAADKKGYSEETIHSVVGFAPAYDARFAILIKLDRPQGVRFAETSITPFFRDIAEYLLNYLEIPSER